jgi:hypothetical protein
MRSYKCLLILPNLLAGSLLLAAMSSDGDTGSIEGFVRDQTGRPIVRVAVQAFNIMHGGVTAAVSQSNGFFRISELVGGRYSLWIQVKGYSAEEIPMLVVEDRQATKKDIQLKRELAHQSRHSMR